MKMISPEEAPSGPLVREYRDVSWRGLLATGIGFALIAVFVVWPKSGNIALLAATFPAVLSLACISLAFYRYTRRKNAWLVKCAADGLYINTNYGDGSVLPGPPEKIMFIPASEVAGITAIREVMRLPHRFGATRHHVACLDLLMTALVTDDTLTAIAMQQARFVKARQSGPYPIRRVAPARLRLNWGWVHPGTMETLGQLSGTYATSPTEAVITYPDWDALTPEQQNLYLDLLWQEGMIQESVFLGRTLHGRSSGEVRDLLERRNQER